MEASLSNTSTFSTDIFCVSLRSSSSNNTPFLLPALSKYAIDVILARASSAVE